MTGGTAAARVHRALWAIVSGTKLVLRDCTTPANAAQMFYYNSEDFTIRVKEGKLVLQGRTLGQDFSQGDSLDPKSWTMTGLTGLTTPVPH